MDENLFSSNADKIRFYLKQLLSDNNEHNRREIVKYIRETPDGEIYTDGMITGALKSLVDAERDTYKNTRRGWYKAVKPVMSAKNEGNPFIQNINSILDATKSNLRSACNFNLLEFSENDIKMTKVKQIADLINYIDRFQNEF